MAAPPIGLLILYLYWISVYFFLIEGLGFSYRNPIITNVKIIENNYRLKLPTNLKNKCTYLFVYFNELPTTTL